MQRIFLFILFLIGLSCYSEAQDYTLSGVCRDKKGSPIENVKVFSEKANPQLIYTNSEGFYTFNFKKLDTVRIVYRFSGEQIVKTVVLRRKNTNVDYVDFSIQIEEEVNVEGSRTDPFEIATLRPTDWQNIPTGSIEKGLVYSTAATSNNELTSNYNVRGGSYEENLVYVNGFNVYRPFLTRSGQQEGMSFINTALVESIQFSAGGFDAEYGDKLSSVLDITYKNPTVFKSSIMASLLGVEMHAEQQVGSRFSYLVGARYRSNGYFLNALPTKGAYNPVFWDAQFLTNYAITEKLTWSVLGHFSSNNYRFAPESQETDFGTANEAYSFRVYFEGQERTQFTTMMGGTSMKWKPTKKLNLDFYATVFNSIEEEKFDILGEYFINELETDPSKEEFGDSIAVLGVGGFLNHARNELNATIVNVYHHGDYTFKNGFKTEERIDFSKQYLKWGVNYQMDFFQDQLSEWKMVDSAGYSIPQSSNNEVILFESLKSDLQLNSQRYTGFVQMNSIWSKNQKNRVVTVSRKYKTGKKGDKKIRREFTDTINNSFSKWAFSIGARTGYTTANSEFYVTPRATVKYFPRAYKVHNEKVTRRNMNIHFATGLYYQPPFYREFRTFDGQLNLNVRAQKSFHAVIGADVYLDMWDREVPFKLTGELYYKHMWDVNSYEVDNVRTRYYANNDAVAYAYGLDLNINGQFVEGIESYFKLGLMQTKEDVLTDYYYDYFNAAGELINFNTIDKVATDSSLVEPGYVPRPTDQWITFGALVQDRMPKFESFTVQMGMQFGAGLPYGPPDNERYKDTLRLKSYFRVDLGMSYDFLYKKRTKSTFLNRNFTDAIISFEVFNLLGINNVLSKQWIQDVSGKFYSIPNNLTARRFNVKLILRFKSRK